MRSINSVRMGKLARLILCLCVLTLVISLVSCSEGASEKDERPLVVSTIFPPYDFARNVAGENAEVELLVDVTDSHSYSPTAMDMVTIEECDVFIYTGGEGDLWAEDFLSTIDCSDKIIINMLDVAEIRYEDSADTHTGHSHASDHEHSTDEAHAHNRADDVIYDEHVWLDPQNAVSITSAIADALCEADSDPAHADTYRANAQKYCASLEALDDELRTVVESARFGAIMVADRFPFRYLCEAYGLEYYAALPGCSSAADLTAVEFEHLAEHLREEGLPVIFTAEYSDGTIARTVKRESGCEDVKILTLHSCHTLTKGQIAEGKSYLSLMRENIAVLRTALGGI